ncbi:ATP-binding cassette domain-containing protein [Flavobacteriales bacterium]|jgi:ATP-binding cassette subfamily F protein 3|nr:ATP-binding cassette domain-containing protein [Flavobacteriales bacterium]
MLNLTNITVSFGGRDLYKNISFQINPKDKIGVVGKNGAGKSTMLKLIIGEQKATSGTINMTNSLSIGYLPQEINVNSNEEILNEVLQANKKLLEINRRLEEINKEITTRTDYESESYMTLLTELSDLNEQLIHLDGDNQLKDAELLLKGLGFNQNEINKPYSSFSGGWKMRVELAKLLIQKPGVVLLDEPTNHLDIESIQWLERYLKSYAGIILLISHDKQFLDNITNRTIELANGKLYDYKSNYSKYLQLREEEIITQIAAKKNQEKMVKHTQELINKFRAKKNKAAFAQSLIKKLDKLEDIEIDQLEKDRIQFQFPEPSHSGKETLKIAGLEKSYGDKQIFKKVDLSIARGEKIALIGKNGMGKSTFIKSIVKDIEFSGNVQLGHQVMMGYFAQDEAHKLDPKKTVFETIDDVAVGEVRKQIRPILGSFLFSGEDIDKKVQVLSGGEKTRLSLCKLLLQPNNFLILDEPTNHLDMASKEILKDALNSYSGTLLLVSHDRGFLDGLTDRVYFIKDQSIKVYHEPVTQFIESYYGNIDEKTVSKKVEVKSTQNKKFQNQQKSIERKITNLEEKQTGLEFELYETSDADRIKNIQDQLSKIKSEIDKNFELLMSIGN